ncbi:MAG: hypothetical protein AAF645_23545 [Myxococcota bacterium]
MGHLRSWRRALLIGFVALLYAPPASASPPDIFGYGARSQAMGLGGAAYANDYEAVYSNPAGLSRTRQYGVHLGLQIGHFDMEFGNDPAFVEAYGGQTIGLQLPLPFEGVLKDTLVIGAGFFAPFQSVLQTDIIFPETASWVVLNRSQSVHLQLGLGINLTRLVPGLRVGVGFAALANIGGRLNVEVDASNQFVSETETQLLASYSPIVGVQYDIGDFAFGFTWHDEVVSDIDLNVVTDIGFDLPVITITATPQYDPHHLAFEGAWQPGDHWLVSAGLSIRLWSKYGGVVGKTTENSNLPPAPDFRNTFTPRLGIEDRATRRRTTASLRAGYVYEMTPAPAADLRPGRDSEGNDREEGGETVMLPVRYIDNDRHIITAGAGVSWDGSFGGTVRFDTFMQAHILPSRTHNLDLGNGSFTSSGFVLAGGFSGSLLW